MSDVTREQVDNARRLADGLDKVAEQWPDRFDMSYWVQLDDRFWDDLYSGSAYDALVRHERGEHPEDCHTVGCALGWGPYLLGEPMLKDCTWQEYGARVLGVRQPDFWWLFSPAAYPEDVTASFVAARIRGWADAQEVTVDA